MARQVGALSLRAKTHPDYFTGGDTVIFFNVAQRVALIPNPHPELAATGVKGGTNGKKKFKGKAKARRTITAFLTAAQIVADEDVERALERWQGMEDALVAAISQAQAQEGEQRAVRGATSDGGGKDGKDADGMGVERHASVEGGVLTDGEGRDPKRHAQNPKSRH